MHESSASRFVSAGNRSGPYDVSQVDQACIRDILVILSPYLSRAHDCWHQSPPDTFISCLVDAVDDIALCSVLRLALSRKTDIINHVTQVGLLPVPPCTHRRIRVGVVYIH